jgi:hypothetical protein
VPRRHAATCVAASLGPAASLRGVRRAPQYGSQMPCCHLPPGWRKIGPGAIQKEVITGTCGVGWNRGKVKD